MVATNLISSVVKVLERELIELSNFNLCGEDYDLILFIPNEAYTLGTKFTLLLSSAKFNNLSHKAVIQRLFHRFQRSLTRDEYNDISVINILHSQDPSVRQLKAAFSLRKSVTEINNLIIGGAELVQGFLVKSLILDKLKEGAAVRLTTISEPDQTLAVGIKRMEHDFDLVCLTAKYLSEAYHPSPKDPITQLERRAYLEAQEEEWLLEQGYLMKIPLDDILQIR